MRSIREVHEVHGVHKNHDIQGVHAGSMGSVGPPLQAEGQSSPCEGARYSGPEGYLAPAGAVLKACPLLYGDGLYERWTLKDTSFSCFSSPIPLHVSGSSPSPGLEEGRHDTTRFVYLAVCDRPSHNHSTGSSSSLSPISNPAPPPLHPLSLPNCPLHCVRKIIIT